MEVRKKIAVFSDFDGTISEKDVCYLLLEKYADFNWQEIDKKWIDGELSTEEAYRTILGRIDLKKSQFDKFIDNVKIDESFVIFYEFCRSNSIEIEIVSDGLDYYIKKILGKYGIRDISIHTNHLEFDGEKWILQFNNTAAKLCPKKNNPCGFCKIEPVLKKKHEGFMTVYIGDGASDRCPASVSDYLFAKGYLANYCRDNNIIHREFKSFEDIKNMVKEILYE